MSHDHDKRVIIYPSYLNSKLKVSEGRRIPKEKACEHPHVGEMHDCCKYLKLASEIEDKSYPRDFLVRGRLRVQLKDEQGRPMNPSIPDRYTMLVKIAELVPKHPNRHKKVVVPAAKGAEASGSGSGSSAAGAKQSAKGNKKKKGK